MKAIAAYASFLCVALETISLILSSEIVFVLLPRPYHSYTRPERSKECVLRRQECFEQTESYTLSLL
jgi:hypothetical protein